MVLAAYVAGVLTLPAGAVGVWWGSLWWHRYRTTQGVPDAPVFPVAEPPAPSLPQAPPRMSRVRFDSVPGSRRTVRGRRR